MRVLVTGHHGYIGSVLAPMLGAAGHEVLGLDTFYYRDCDFGPATEWRPATELDVRNARPADLGGIDSIVHLAALSNDPIGDLNPAWTYGINLDGTIALAVAAKQAGVARFVFASSCSMYGAASTDVLIGEEAPLRPLTPYAESKVRAEEALFALADERFAVVSMRNATAYGVSPRLRLDIVLNNLVAWAQTTGEIRLQSDGSAWRPLVHIRDISRAALTLLDAPSEWINGQAFNIGSDDQNYRIRALAEIVENRLPECSVTFAEEAATDPRSYRVSFAKFAERFPTFACDWDAVRGVDELAQAYASLGLSADELVGQRYLRLGRLKHLLSEGLLVDDLRWAPAAAS